MRLIEERLDGKCSSRTEENAVRIPRKTLDDLLKDGAERENGFLRVPPALIRIYDLPTPPDSAYPPASILTYQITEVQERVLGVDPQHGRVTGSTRVLYELTLTKHNP